MKDVVIDPEWMTTELITRGFLTSGSVKNLRLQPADFLNGGETGTARLYTAEFSYSPESIGELPDNCLVKIGKPERFDWNRKEVVFYNLMKDGPVRPGLVSCYGAAIHETSRETVLFLENRGGSRHMTEYPVPPEIEACERAVKALAEFHASWWNSPRFEEPPFEPMNAERLSLLTDSVFRPAVTQFIERMGGHLSKRRRRLLEKLADGFVEVLDASQQARPCMTLVHSDAHFWNFLIPDDPSQSTAIIDWQLWEVDMPAWDLAYMIAMHWFPERRARYEDRLLRVYQQTLEECGVDYPSEALREDYRVSVLRTLSNPVLRAYFDTPAEMWWHHLERAYLAVEDWDAAALLN